jgi:hypothetical protein
VLTIERLPLAVAGGDDPHVGAAHLAGQLHAEVGVADAARVDELVRRVELLEAVEEERPLLRVEESEALIEQDLPDVGLDLREVRLPGAVEAEVLRDPPACVEAQLRDAVVRPPRGVAAAVEPLRAERRQLQHQPAVQVVEALERAGLAEERRAGADHGSPRVLEAGVLDPAQDVDAPGLLPALLVAQALERDPDLDFIAAGDEAAARLEDVVRVQVHVPVEEVEPDAAPAPGHPAGAAGELIAAGAVLLDAERVDAEEEGAPPVVVGVEEDLDVVVAADVVAVGARRADGVAVGLVRADPEPDGVGGVPDEDLGVVLRRAAVHGLVLGEAGEARGLRPHRLVEHPIHAGGCREPGDGDGELPVAAAEGAAGVRDGRRHDGEEGEEHGRGM